MIFFKSTSYVTMTLLIALMMVTSSSGFYVPTQNSGSSTSNMRDSTVLSANRNGNDDDKSDKPKNFLDDLKGMFQNMDDVVDDFVMKRMGAGEQWYGKRKYNPSGRIDGDYNGMGRSSHYSIEIARVQKEVLEERRQKRLEDEKEAAARRNQ